MFRHELARLTMLEEVPRLRRIGLHRKILDALEAAGADPARMAHHAESAGLGEAAARPALVAAERAAPLGPHKEAAEPLELATRPPHAGPAPARAGVRARLSYERYVTSRIDEARSARLE